VDGWRWERVLLSWSNKTHLLTADDTTIIVKGGKNHS
jgi:hypothetical protein